MKILIFYQYFGTPAGSWSTRMYEMTRRWVQEGHTVTVVSSPYEKSDIKAEKFISRSRIEGINLVIINSADSNRKSIIIRGFNALLFSLTSCILALKEPCDVVIASSGPITVGIPALIIKWFRKKKMIFEIRDLWPQGAIEMGKINNSLLSKIAFGFEKLCYKNSAMVVACSEGMSQSVNERFPQVPTLVIPNASDVDLFRDNTGFRLPEQYSQRKIIVYTGSLGLMDHGQLMINAMKLIQDPEIILIVIGDGAERNDMENEVSKYQLKNVMFLGLIPKKDVVGWIQNAFASLILFKDFPVLQTSSPNKLFDAFAAGIPVIHNTSGWIKDLTEKEKCGLSVPHNDPKKLAEAIEMLASDKLLQKSMAENSMRMADTKYNRDKVSMDYIEAIKNLI